MSTDKPSKRLSYLLRHKPEAAGITLDQEGWAVIDDLVKKAGFTVSEIQTIVTEDKKQRYAVSDNGTKIRANQGHSTDQVKLTHKKAIPPVELFHGTRRENLVSIYKKGLIPGKRHHVHLSSDEKTAEEVGSRRKGDLVILRVNTQRMVADGITFYLSENNVWLVDFVDHKYIAVKA